jgi:PilZ domain
MPRPRSRQSTSKPKLLTSFRCMEGDVVTSTGFGRTLNIGDDQIMLESPDEFPVGQVLDLEFLLDNDQIADARGHVTRINKGKGLYRVKVEFDKLSAKSRRLLARQVAG